MSRISALCPHCGGGLDLFYAVGPGGVSEITLKCESCVAFVQRERGVDQTDEEWFAAILADFHPGKSIVETRSVRMVSRMTDPGGLSISGQLKA